MVLSLVAVFSLFPFQLSSLLSKDDVRKYYLLSFGQLMYSYHKFTAYIFIISSKISGLVFML